MFIFHDLKTYVPHLVGIIRGQRPNTPRRLGLHEWLKGQLADRQMLRETIPETLSSATELFECNLELLAHQALSTVKVETCLLITYGTMDFSNLKDQVSNLSLYDLKAGVRKVQMVSCPTGQRELG